MSAHMKKHPTNGVSKVRSQPLFYRSEQGQFFRLPKTFAAKLARYRVTDRASLIRARNRFGEHLPVLPEEAFLGINQKYTKAGALLKAVRLREGLSQKALSEKIQVEQGDLSKMENGKRAIGKEIAHRISEHFKVNYRFFLE